MKKPTPEELRAISSLSEQKLLHIVTENARVGLVIFDPHRRYVYANSTYAEMLGLPSSGLGGRRLADVLPDVYEEQIRPRLDQAFAGERIAYELRRVIRGDERHFAVRLEPTAVDGAVAFVVVVITDITEQIRGEEERHFQQTMLMTERELALDAILVVDEYGKVLSYNGRFAQMWAIPTDVLTTRVDAVLLQSVRDKLQDPAAFMTRVQQLYDNPEEESHDEVDLKDGRVLERYSAPMRDANGRYYGRVWYFRDVTERKHALSALREERDRAQRYLDTAEVIMLALDTKGRITLINRKGCDLLGRTEEELLGKDWVTTCLPPEIQGELREKFEALVGGDLSPVVNPILTKDGEERMIDWRNTVLKDEHGRVVGTLSSGTDVTERRKLEEQYHQAQKMEAVGRLAGGVAHDFNNMLTLVLAYCQLLLDDLKSDDPMRSDIQEIYDAGEGAARLTRQLLSLSRRQIIEPKLLDLNELIGNARGMLGRIVGENVNIVLNLGTGLPVVFADGGQVEQVLVNLAINASDAMPDGGTLNIETANVDLDERENEMHPYVTPGSYVALTVSDTGGGMSADVQARLFEPFFTTKEIGKGTGLGLAAVHGIVTRNGGYVAVRSELGRGSTFIVYFPPAPEQKVPEAKPVTARPETGEMILVVEDAEGLRGLTRKILLRQGYRVMVAANAVEAAQIVEQQEAIDLILTDVMMPGGSGPALMRDLLARRPDLKVVYMSGYSEDEISHHGVLDPGIAFLQKPFTAETLSRKIREALDR